MVQELKGWHVLTMFIIGFGIIVSVNLTLAYNAVATFPGLEVKNSYVASQKFDRERVAQEALNWDVGARVEQGNLWLTIDRDGAAVQPTIEKATFGRATYAGADQFPTFTHTGDAFVAPVDIAPGNWNLRLEARAEDGTLFRQRIVVEVIR